MTLKISARPGINGNSTQDFYLAYYALKDAERTVLQALQVLSSNVTHGRNYQHLEDATDRKIDETSAIHEMLRVAIANINTVASALGDVITEE